METAVLRADSYRFANQRFIIHHYALINKGIWVNKPPLFQFSAHLNGIFSRGTESSLHDRFVVIAEIGQRVDDGQHLPAQLRQPVLHPRRHLPIVAAVTRGRRPSSGAGCRSAPSGKCRPAPRCSSLNRHGRAFRLRRISSFHFPPISAAAVATGHAGSSSFVFMVNPSPRPLWHILFHMCSYKKVRTCFRVRKARYCSQTRRACESFQEVPTMAN